jgi:hypothetical protein
MTPAQVESLAKEGLQCCVPQDLRRDSPAAMDGSNQFLGGDSIHVKIRNRSRIQNQECQTLHYTRAVSERESRLAINGTGIRRFLFTRSLALLAQETEGCGVLRGTSGNRSSRLSKRAPVLGDRFRVYFSGIGTHPVSPVRNVAADEAGRGHLPGRGQQRARSKPAISTDRQLLARPGGDGAARAHRNDDPTEIYSAAAARTRRGPRERKQAFGRCANLPMPGTHRDVAGGARAQEAPTRPGLFVLPDSASETATQHNQP